MLGFRFTGLSQRGCGAGPCDVGARLVGEHGAHHEGAGPSRQLDELLHGVEEDDGGPRRKGSGQYSRFSMAVGIILDRP